MLRVLAAAGIFSVYLSGQATPSRARSQEASRLPVTVVPLRYAAELRIMPGADDFEGTITIQVQLTQPASAIRLHAKELSVRNVSIDGTTATASAEPDDILVITPTAVAAEGTKDIRISYTGKISRVLTDGVFQQQYNGDSYVFTKFEPVTARRAFPCFDEPSFKTPWQLTLIVPTALKSVSNTPVIAEQDQGNGSKTVRFAPTKPLPSYLVAFGVGPFDFVDGGRAGRNNVPMRIIVPKGRASEAAFAAANTGMALESLEKYFGVPYPYEKLDQIVVPLTTAWGAMENAGLIAYGQFLLVKPAEDSLPQQKGRLSTMIHEIAHQWFGDLVTIAWWDDLWLAEGFASWLSPKIEDRLHPEWNTGTSAVAGSDTAKNADALVSARKVRQPIGTAGDIALAFDSITYVKGSALLRMFENWVGEESFQRGIQAYLTEHSWKNATTQDLAEALTKAAGRDIVPSFASLLNNTGIPVIEGRIRCDGSRPVLDLEQHRFTPIGTKQERTSNWRLPVCMRSAGGRECVELTAPRQSFELKTTSTCPDWYYLNENGAGYYRSRLDNTWSDKLAANSTRLKPAEIVTLLQDMRALVDDGSVDPGKAFLTAKLYSNSGDPDVIASAIRVVGSVSDIVPDDLRATYTRIIRSWFGDRAQQLGWKPQPNDSDATRRIRISLVSFVAREGVDPKLRAGARELADQWLQDPDSVDPDIAPAVLYTAAESGDRPYFDALVKELRTRKNQRDRYMLIGALSSFKDPELTKSALELILHGGTGIDQREIALVLMFPNRDSRQLIWDYVRKNFDELNAKLPGARGIPYGSTLPATAAGFCSTARASEVEAFYKPRIPVLSGSERNVDQTLERIRNCAARRQALEGPLRTFLQQHE